MPTLRSSLIQGVWHFIFRTAGTSERSFPRIWARTTQSLIPACIRFHNFVVGDSHIICAQNNSIAPVTPAPALSFFFSGQIIRSFSLILIFCHRLSHLHSFLDLLPHNTSDPFNLLSQVSCFVIASRAWLHSRLSWRGFCNFTDGMGWLFNSTINL